MKRFFYTSCLILAASFASLGQNAPAETPRVELFGGYANGGSSQGWNTSLTANVNKWFGIVGDFGAQSSNVKAVDFQEKIQSRSYLVGPQFSFRHKRVTPFARVMVGGATVKTMAVEAGETFSFSDTGFAWAVGGGLDVRVSKRVAIRAFQLDYLRTKFFGESQHNARLSFGMMFRFGSTRSNGDD